MLDRGPLVGADQDQVGGQGNGQIRHLVHLGVGGGETRAPLMIFDGGGCKSLLLKRITDFSMFGTISGMIWLTFTFPWESIRASCLTSPALFLALKKPQRMPN